MKEAEVSIPDKLFFKIGEVSELLGLPSHVLRFWETEFKRIKPKRTPSGQRLYRKNDVVFILRIKHLLYEKGFTISGARQHLRNQQSITEALSRNLTIGELRHELEQIRDLIK
jgi:DNA-binding transcriptional MerR regulator